MGRAIAQAALSRGHHLRAIIDPTLRSETAPGIDTPTDTQLFDGVSSQALADCDVAIEFSSPDVVIDNIGVYASSNVAAVIGTTGWHDRIGEAERLWSVSKRGMVYGANFSIGAHVLFRTAAYASSLVADLTEYDLLVHEIHHGRKKDSPSGTALTLSRYVMEAAPRKKRIEPERLGGPAQEAELHVSSSRGGWFPGTHTLYLDSEADTVEIRHQARSRHGFVTGAVAAAEWIKERRGVFAVETFVTDLLGK
jgi:4-hydroxy-tetrahydrodipicolinate reductase